MEIVPGVGAVVTGAGLAGVDREDRFCARLVLGRGCLSGNELAIWLDVVETGPLEQEFARSNVKLYNCVNTAK